MTKSWVKHYREYDEKETLKKSLFVWSSFTNHGATDV
jgi:hypothetical protein